MAQPQRYSRYNPSDRHSDDEQTGSTRFQRQTRDTPSSGRTETLRTPTQPLSTKFQSTTRSQTIQNSPAFDIVQQIRSLSPTTKQIRTMDEQQLRSTTEKMNEGSIQLLYHLNETAKKTKTESEIKDLEIQHLRNELGRLINIEQERDMLQNQVQSQEEILEAFEDQKEEEISALKERIAFLDAEQIKLFKQQQEDKDTIKKVKLANLDTQNDNLARISALEKDAENREEFIKQLEDELAELREMSKSDLQEKNAQLTQLTRERDQAARNSENLQTQLAQIQSKGRSAETSLASVVNDMANVQTLIQKCANAVLAIDPLAEHDYSHMLEMIADLDHLPPVGHETLALNTQGLISSTKDLLTDYVDLISKQGHIKQDQQRASLDLRSAEGEITRLKTQLRSAEGENSRLRERAQTLEAELVQQQSHGNTNQDTLAHLTDEVEKRNALLQTILQRLDPAKEETSTPSDFTSVEVELMETIDAVNENLIEYRQDSTTQRGKVADLQKEVEKLKTELETAKQDGEKKAEQQKETLLDENDKLRSQLREAEEALFQKEEEFEREVDVKTADLQRQVFDLQTAQNGEEMKSQTLSDELNEMRVFAAHLNATCRYFARALRAYRIRHSDLVFQKKMLLKMNESQERKAQKLNAILDELLSEHQVQPDTQKSNALRFFRTRAYAVVAALRLTRKLKHAGTEYGQVSVHNNTPIFFASDETLPADPPIPFVADIHETSPNKDGEALFRCMMNFDPEFERDLNDSALTPTGGLPFALSEIVRHPRQQESGEDEDTTGRLGVLSTFAQNIRELENERRNAQRTVSELTDELSHKQKELEIVEENKVHQDALIDVMETRLKELEAKSETAIPKQQFAEMEKRKSELTRKVEQLEREKDQLSRTVSQQQKELGQKKEEAKKLEVDLRAERENRQEKEDEGERRREELDRLRKEVKKKEEDEEELKKMLKRQRDAVDAADAKRKQNEREIQRLREKVEQNEEKGVMEETQARELADQVQTLQMEQQWKDEEAEKLRKENKRLGEEIAVMSERINQMATDLRKTSLQNTELEKENTRLKSQQASLRKENEFQTRRLERQKKEQLRWTRERLEQATMRTEAEMELTQTLETLPLTHTQHNTSGMSNDASMLDSTFDSDLAQSDWRRGTAQSSRVAARRDADELSTPFETSARNPLRNAFDTPIQPPKSSTQLSKGVSVTGSYLPYKVEEQPRK